MSARSRTEVLRDLVKTCDAGTVEQAVETLRCEAEAEGGFWMHSGAPENALFEIEMHGLVSIGLGEVDAVKRWLRQARTALQVDA